MTKITAPLESIKLKFQGEDGRICFLKVKMQQLLEVNRTQKSISHSDLWFLPHLSTERSNSLSFKLMSDLYASASLGKG